MLHKYSYGKWTAFMVEAAMQGASALQNLTIHTHTHTHTEGHASKGQFGVQYTSQGHFDMRTRGSQKVQCNENVELTVQTPSQSGLKIPKD